MDEADDGMVFDIDDPRVPAEIRAHGLRFRNPARYVEYLGDGEFSLLAADGELLDLVCLD